MEKETKLVQMRLKPKTLRSVENLSEILDIDNKAYITAQSISLTSMIVDEIKAGNNVYIENKKGEKTYLKFSNI